jgi:hypothetical protein
MRRPHPARVQEVGGRNEVVVVIGAEVEPDPLTVPVSLGCSQARVLTPEGDAGSPFLVVCCGQR